MAPHIPRDLHFDLAGSHFLLMMESNLWKSGRLACLENASAQSIHRVMIICLSGLWHEQPNVLLAIVHT